MGSVVTGPSGESLARPRAAAVDALTNYDIEIRRVRLFVNGFNCIYRVESAQGDQYVMRLSATHGCHDVDETRAELAWLAALRRDTDLRVPKPISMRNGDLVGVLGKELGARHHQYVLFAWMTGRTPGERVGISTATRTGELAARLHAHAQSFTLPDGRARRFDSAFPYANEAYSFVEPVLLFDDVNRDLFKGDLYDIYTRARDRVERVTRALFETGASVPRLIHNDLHPWNLLVHKGEVSAIDFEDLMWGFPLQDIATTFYYFLCRPNGIDLMRAYRQGYESVATWPGQDDGAGGDALSTLVAGRGLILANTVLASPDRELRRQADHYLPLIGQRIETCLAGLKTA